MDIGPAMTAKVLKANGQVLYLSTYWLLTLDELADPELTKKCQDFDTSISQKLGEPMSADVFDELDPDMVTPEYQLYEDDLEPSFEVPDVNAVTPEYQDDYIGAKVSLPVGGMQLTGKVKKRAHDEDGELYGSQNVNPILDTRVYEIEYPDGKVQEYAANVIVENMYAQCDVDGNQYLLLGAIIDHKADGNAVKHADWLITCVNSVVLDLDTHIWVSGFFLYDEVYLLGLFCCSSNARKRAFLSCVSLFQGLLY